MALFNHSCAPNAAITRLGTLEAPWPQSAYLPADHLNGINHCWDNHDSDNNNKDRTVQARSRKSFSASDPDQKMMAFFFSRPKVLAVSDSMCLA